MSIEILVGALEEYISLKREIESNKKDLSDEDTLSTLREAKKRFAKALNQYIDWRVRGALAEGLKKDSSKTIPTLQAPNEELTNAPTVPPPPDYSRYLVHPSMAIINEAPVPIKDVSKESKEIKLWMAAYTKWYHRAKKML